MPGSFQRIWGQPQRYVETYYAKYNKDKDSKDWHDWPYFAGDGAVQAADGYFRILGRVDDVINFAGHRLGTKEIGSIARPKNVWIVTDMPKTRSGKIMRRVIASISNFADVGDVTTLANPEIVEEIRHHVQSEGSRTAKRRASCQTKSERRSQRTATPNRQHPSARPSTRRRAVAIEQRLGRATTATDARCR